MHIPFHFPLWLTILGFIVFLVVCFIEYRRNEPVKGFVGHLAVLLASSGLGFFFVFAYDITKAVL